MDDFGYHIIQSFNGNEISPDKCNKIGIELAKQLWGDKYQVIVCTHTNKENVHNHIVLNSVSFIDGSKYHNSNVEIALLRETNDDICRKYGLSVIETKKATKERYIARSRIKNYNRNSGKMELIKADIDEAIKVAKKYQEFVDILSYKGYYIKRYGNGMSISSPYYNRNIRLARAFGEDYTFDNIKSRIYSNDAYKMHQTSENEKIYKIRIYNEIKIDQERLKTSSFYRLYVHYLYLLGKLPPKIHYEERTKEYYQELDKFHKTNDEIKMIISFDLHSIKDTQKLKTQFLEEVKPLKNEREKLWRAFNKTTNKNQKKFIKDKIATITDNINKINKEIQTCKRIINNSEKGEREDNLIKKRVKENQVKNEKEFNKNKDKSKIR